MTMFRNLLIAFILALICTPVLAGMTTSEILQDCNSDANSFEQGPCLGAIHAVAAVLIMNHYKTPDNGLTMCVTGNLSSDATLQAFKNWAERNPKELERESIIGVVSALRDTWPCK